MPTTILDNETYPEALQRRYAEEIKVEKQAEIIRMAREAGMLNINDRGLYGDFVNLERFAALVAEPLIETNKALAKEIIELKKQVEQEPMAWMNEINGFICKEKTRSYHVPLYAHPVRTKDLTDVDLWNLWEKSDSNVEFARAVIAAFKEKQK